MTAGLSSVAVLLGAALAYSGPPKPPPANGFPPMPATIVQPGSVITATTSSAGITIALQPPPASAKALAPPPPVVASREVGEKAKRGVVTLERAGQVLGLGVVLAKDGRILTALSPLGDGGAIDARYADGSVVHALLGHQDRVWDLALLVPQIGRWAEGLAASEADPARPNAQLFGFSSAGGKAQLLPVTIKGHKTLLGADEALLRDALDLAGKIGPKELGTPIVDEAGSVVAVVARGCVPAEGGACTPAPFGAPVDVVRRFLQAAPAQAAPLAPWLGMQVITDQSAFARGVRVQVVQPESPADDARLRGGSNRDKADLVVAVDGAPVTTPEALAEAIRAHAVGDKVTLLVFSEGKFREVPVVLRAAPSAAEAAAPAGRGGLPPLPKPER